MKHRPLLRFAPFVLASLLHAGPPITVTVTIQRILEIHCDEGIGTPCPNDYYAEVTINGENAGRAPASGGFTSSDFQANWKFARVVDSDRGTVPVQIRLYDEDTLDDDAIDISPASTRELNLQLDLATGDWTGDVDNKEEAEGNEPEDRARIYFDIDIGKYDTDGDGIPDRVERFSMAGADPCRKTIAVEIEYMEPNPASHTHRPLQAALDEVIAAFDIAPVPASTPCPYPGFPLKPSGIGLILNFGQTYAEEAITDWAGLEARRSLNFGLFRRQYIHYSLWAHAQADGSSGLCCEDGGKDFLVTLGGFTSQVGTVREQSGTFMHELGHALGLHHGGDQADNRYNCKPNYLSVMNYLFQFTGLLDSAIVPRNVDIDGNGVLDAGSRLDYSRSILAPLDENKLIEANGIGAGTAITFWSPDGGTTKFFGNGTPINWNNSPDTNPDGSVTVDLNRYGIPRCDVAALDTLIGFRDWDNLKYRAAASPDAGSIIPPVGPEMTAESARLIRESLLAPPNLDILVSPGPNAFGWNNSDVTVRLRAVSPVGVASVRYALTGAEQLATQIVTGETASFILRTEGETVITYSASNAYGNTPPKTLTVRIDKTPPFPSLVAMFCMLHPESREMAKVGSAAAIDDRSGVDPSSFALTVTSSEPDAGIFPGDLPNDIAIAGLSVWVRAERNPAGTGRRYYIDNAVRDFAGNGAVRRSECRVPLFLQ